MNETGGVDSMLLEAATPDYTTTLTSTIWDVEDLNNYRARFTVWLTPPTTGEYQFRIAVDDDMRIWLGKTANPADARLIVSRNGWVGVNTFTNANQYSGPIQLEAGRVYFLRSGMREGTGGDHMHLQWRGPGFDWRTISGPAMNSTLPTPIEVGPHDQELVHFEHWNYVVPDNVLPAAVDIENDLPGFPSSPASTGLLPKFTDTPGDPQGNDAGEGYVLRERAVIKADRAKGLGFATSSDDASMLYVGPWWEASPTYVHVVDNNGGHGAQLRYGAVEVPAGYVGVTVTMCEGTGGDSLNAYFWDLETPRSNLWRPELGPEQLISQTRASVPSPINGEIGVPLDAVLTWEQPWGIEAPQYKVYVWEQGAAQPAAVSTTETYFDPDLNAGTAYWWQVNVIDPNEGGNPVEIEGVQWAFATQLADIRIVAQPSHQTVDHGSEVALTVVAESALMPLSYQWKKDGGDIGGAQDATLVIASFDKADNGVYACVITNGEATVETAGAAIAVRELMAYWPLDGDLQDHAKELDPIAEGGKHATFMVNDPNTLDDVVPDTTVPYVAGKIGNAVQFDGSTQFAYAGTWNPNAVSKELSVSLWTRWDGPTGVGATGTYQGLIGKRDTYAANNMMWQVELNHGQVDADGTTRGNMVKTFQSNGGGGGASTVKLPVAGEDNKVSYGGRVLYSSQHLTNANEHAYRAFDGVKATKWLAPSNTAWVTYIFPAERSYVVTSYAITSGNDSATYPARDPDDWTLQGSNDGVTWDILDTQVGQAAGWTANYETRIFDLSSNTTAYKMYKLDITKARDPATTIIQISEIEFFADAPLEDTWVNIVSTFDGSIARTYINGWFVRESTFAFASDTESSVVFGSCQADPAGGGELGSKPWGGNLFKGALDDIKIYNYELSPTEVLAAYMAVEGGQDYCLDGTQPDLDLDGNCVVDTVDLLMFLDDWMKDNLGQ